MSGAIIEINTSVMRCFFVVYKIKEYEIEAKYKELGMENVDSDYFKFIAIFSDELTDSEMEDVLNDYYE